MGQDPTAGVHGASGATSKAVDAPEASDVSAESNISVTVPVADMADSSDATLDRPTDEEILLQQNLIRAEEASKIPYVSNKEDLGNLKEEYASGSAVFLTKIDGLAQAYSGLRRTRGDGNCFFRAFAFSLLEGLLLGGDRQEGLRLQAVLQGWRSKLVEVGFQELVFEDALELLLEQVSAILSPSNPLALEVLEANMQDDTISNMLVMMLRMVASAEIQRRMDFFAPFIMGMYDDPPASVELFCQRYVEPMGEESDHVHIVALTDALQVPVRVMYLDRSNGGGGEDSEVNAHDFVPEVLPPGTSPRVHLLYRPGHYDILYPMGS